MKKQKIGVIGIGFMGKGIVYAFAAAGYDVVAITRQKKDFRFLKYIEKKVNKEYGITQNELQEITDRVYITNELSELKDCCVIIETIPEKLEQKTNIWKKVDKIGASDAIFASNTSTISITQLSNACPKHKSRFIGLHFMSPVEKMKLVELIKTTEVEDRVISQANELITSLSKEPVVVKDYPGFVISRLMAVYVNEAVAIASEGVANIEDIDNITKLGLNYPVGPFRLADEVGLDVVLNVLENLYKYLKNPKYDAHTIIRQLVDSGRLGRKTGHGFYDYNK
ncbi:3-hydroxyacyl-CoA dehydrogenase family protein [Streptococcus mutans]|uniref:3-hydroxyacyl-CoA dehydrogenase family protein n=1 Tax=Streptococcus mutans TaxID=1309 RepID=UPI000F70EC05|nr:3-hydroxyacyl-CoA dehydrogenase family protein [Streptococcus mutans]MCB5050636.1 3-hydroxyacyl-CoA dehydrogenase family protein [Streptococcus mutans]MCB5080073.1 3-hydroxyacyl-CoA dehydrogenase family protein [Streptococcus mutans]MCY7117620.1 3-hydroxyacyl-CoA dehydrogenase family protein [Streptococcus mutans]MCY7125219.1 3-hydroxyacyl-CoA dehydrogenase family protein [Streptococcus mutans]MDT9539618.1 3-hydroxyacyl-CoA dehydrogenase family protein [Streptococcus mutans]